MNLHCLIKEKVSPLHLNLLGKNMPSSNDNLNNEDITLIAKKFRKFMFKKKKINKGEKVNDFIKINESDNESKIKTESRKIVKCFECLGYGHLRNECPNFKRNKGKALNVTLSDESNSEIKF